MPDVVNQVRSQLEKRLRELEPHVKEHAQIREALEGLANAVAPQRRTRQPASASAQTTPATKGRRGRPRGSGGRSQEALKLVTKRPGITISEMAKQMKISPNYLYRVLPQLEKDGKVKKEGKGYTPTQS